MMIKLLVAALGAVCLSSVPALSIDTVDDQGVDAPELGSLDKSIFDALQWRNIGPRRGGRVQSVCGVAGDPMTYYMGATGGGVWKTTNAGHSWSNITDGFLTTGSVGAVAVAPSDSNVIYVGTGEADIRGNFSHGDGVYRSEDAGKTWKHVGLKDTRQIGRIIVHPDNPDTVFVAALGHVFGNNAERGIFRSDDGGDTWQKVLYVNDRTGAIDIAMDPNNERVLFAAFWQVHRTPWSLESGGEGSGLYRSTDGGESWEPCTRGLPSGIKGKINVSVSKAKKDRVWAIVESKDGGVFRSENGGDSWTRVNSEAKLRQRAWYYTHIIADTIDPDTVYVMNVGMHRSTDGGKTFQSIRVPHSDNHDLWIAPENNLRMINANDGGANVSFDGGATWSRQDNQPTAQFYGVATDNNFPYRVLGAQQDNSTMSISSQNRPWGREDFYAVGGGESGYIAARPDNPDIVYAGSYLGYLTRYDHSVRKTRNIQIWPENSIGDGPADLEVRFQWTFPIVVSSHNPDVLYAAGNKVFRSENEGQSWNAISPDLTTNDKTRQQSSGGPITKDNTSVEYYCTVFTLAESPHDSNVLWAGTDDGLVHITNDGGETWTNITPSGIGDWPLISLIEASPHDVDTAWIAVNRYKMDDLSPMICRTTDGGETWSLLGDDIDEGAFVRSVREDPVRPGLLYAATETGVWFSMNHGDNWAPLQQNLPVVPVTDLVVKDNDLVIATQGRSFWILNGLSLLRQLTPAALEADCHLFTPARTWRQRWDAARIAYRLAEDCEERVTLTILDESDNVVRTFDSTGDLAGPRLAKDEGLHVFRWNLRHEDPVRVPGAVGWPGTPPGPSVAPGIYIVRLEVGSTSFDTWLTISPDPRLSTTAAEFKALESLQLDIRDTISDAHTAVNQIRAIRKQIDAAVDQATGMDRADEIAAEAKAISASLTSIEEAIIQTKSKSSQDPLNYPVRLNDKIGALMGSTGYDYGPPDQMHVVFEMLKAKLQVQLDAMAAIVDEEIPAFNALVHEAAVPAVRIDKDDQPE